MEQFIGIVRGRTVNSSRERPAEPARKKTEKAKAEAKKRAAAQPARGKGRGRPRR